MFVKRNVAFKEVYLCKGSIVLLYNITQHVYDKIHIR